MTVSDVFRELSKKGIEIRTLMGGTVKDQNAFYEIFQNSSIPNAQSMSETTFFTGIHQTLTAEDIDSVSENIYKLLAT